jgi:hypothetical protein
MAFQIDQPDMTKHRPPPSKAAGRERQFEKLLAATGIAELNPFLRAGLEGNLRQIEGEYARRAAQLSKQPNRKLVRSYRAGVMKQLSLCKKVGPDFLAEIEEAGWSRQNPNADVGHLHMVMTDWMTEHSHERADLIAVLTAHVLDIDHWLKTTGETYKKRYVRKLVVEPFLQLIAEQGITTSRKDRPRYGMVQALFEWIGIEKQFRLSSAAISAIARELEGSASASKSNAKRRTKN